MSSTQTVFPMRYEMLPYLTRQAVLKRDKYTCQKCLKKSIGRKLDIHHKIARRMGGTHDMDNMITLCRKCHKSIEPAFSRRYAYKLEDNKTTVQVKHSTLKLIKSFGKYGESYDDILSRFLGIPKKKKEKDPI